MSGILTIAEKELRDFVTGKRFLIIFGLIVIMTIFGMISGMQNYDTQLEQYKQQQAQNQPMITQMQQEIIDAEARGDDAAMIQNMKDNLENMLNPWMPSVLDIFYNVTQPMSLAGSALAIVMGFDLITREREEGSLKQLLTRPLYRDTVIIGKAVSGIAAIVIMVGATFLIAMAILLIYGIVPQGDDLYRIAAFFGVTVLFIACYFTLSLMVSTLTRSSTMAILCMLGLFLIFYLVPSVSYQATQMIIGPYPSSPDTSSIYQPSYGGNYTPPTDEQTAAMNEVQWKYQNDSIAYSKKQQQISDIISYTSPYSSYSALYSVIISKQKPWDAADMYSSHGWSYKALPLADTLMPKWSYILALLVEIVAALGLSYLFFMRSDVA